MTRIEPFNYLLPRRTQFHLPNHIKGLKSKLIYNDYHLFYETSNEAKRRLFESTGILLEENAFESYEYLNKD